MYLGRVEYGKTFKARYYKLGVNGPVELDDPDGEIVQGDNPEGQWYSEDERHEGIITVEEWDAAQTAITARKNHPSGNPRSKKRDFLLRGILRCAHCGGAFYGQVQTNPNGSVTISYICSTARKHGIDQCPSQKHSVPARELEEFVLSRVRQYFVEVCPKEALKVGLERIFSEREESLEEVESIRREMDAFNKRKDRTFQQIVTSGKVELFQKNLDAMEEEGKVLESRLSAAVARSTKTLSLTSASICTRTIFCSLKEGARGH